MSVAASETKKPPGGGCTGGNKNSALAWDLAQRQVGGIDPQFEQRFTVAEAGIGVSLGQGVQPFGINSKTKCDVALSLLVTH